jgi:predicted transcriptional regulator
MKRMLYPKKILSRLIVRPTRQHEACECAVKDSTSIKKAITVFYWLRDHGFIRKMGKNYFSPFEVTEKGRLFYKALSYDD